MIYLVIILSITIAGLIVYLILLQMQIYRMNALLRKRVKEQTRQPVSLDMIHAGLNSLAGNINICLKAEENLRMGYVREENKFKEMIVNISHDLRTPLTAVKGYLQLLVKGELTEEQKDKLKVAIKHTNELGNLIEHFFEYAYLLNHTPEIHLQRININNLVTETIVSLITVLEEKEINLDYTESEPVFIFGDRQICTRIMQNLLRNCAQHAAGDIGIQIVARDYAVLSLTNPVFEPDKIDPERLFDRFYAGDSARSHSTGLGLSIVKLLTEQMGGNANACIEGNILKIEIELPIVWQKGE